MLDLKIFKEIQNFNRERNEALLSMDEDKIRAHHRKWAGEELPTNLFFFWTIIHKAITGQGSLPKEFRQRSKDWLDARELRSHDDGELA